MVMYAFHYQSYLQVFATCIVSEGFFVLDLTPCMWTKYCYYLALWRLNLQCVELMNAKS